MFSTISSSIFRAVSRFIASMFKNWPENQVMPDPRHLEVARRIFRVPSNAHHEVFTLFNNDSVLARAMPVDKCPLLIKVVVGDTDVFINVYRVTRDSVLKPLWASDWGCDGELRYLLNAESDRMEPVQRPITGMWYNPYEPEISYVRALAMTEIKRMDEVTLQSLLRFENGTAHPA